MALKHTVVLVDSIKALNECLSDISPAADTGVAKLAIDLEGIDLCRHGRISILQIVAANSNIIWLIDITTLGKMAFEHADDEGRNLKAILEGGRTKKVSSETPKNRCLFMLFTDHEPAVL